MIMDGGGLLIDWDLSKVISPEGESGTARRYARTVSWLHVAVYPTPDISLHQGTWQFMAADLVESPRATHTFAQDLESFFWVLLWVVLKQVSTTWSDQARTSFLKTTMGPKLYTDCAGNEKSTFLTSAQLDRHDPRFQIIGNHFLCDLVKNLKATVSGGYYPEPQMWEASGNPASEEDKDNFKAEHRLWEERQGYLQNHSKMLEHFEFALNEENEWPQNDKATVQPILRSNSSANVTNTSPKRSRSIAESSGVYTPNKRRA
jgi:hypothetical protein